MIPIGTVYACMCRTTAEANQAITTEAERDGATITPIELIYGDDDETIVGAMATVTGHLRSN
jgi:hypothetical protein